MFQGLGELSVRSKTGIYLFWARILMFIFMAIMISYSIYWSVLVSDASWLSIVGGSLLAINIFNIIFSFIAFIVLLFSIFGLLSKLEKILTQIFFIALIAAIIDCCVALTYSTDEKFFLSYQLILNRCSNEINASTFCTEHPTVWSMRKFVRERTSDPYGVMATLTGFLIVSIIAMAILVYIQIKNAPKSEDPEQGQDQSPLLDTQQNEQDDPSAPDPEESPAQDHGSQHNQDSDQNQGYEYYSYEEELSEKNKTLPAVEKPVARARNRAPPPRTEPDPETLDDSYYEEEEESFHTR